MSWFFFAITLITLFDALFTIIDPYFQIPTSELWKELFEFVVYVNIGIAISFTIFPLIHFYQFDPWGIYAFFFGHRNENEQLAAYKHGEILYIYASFVAKTDLAS